MELEISFDESNSELTYRVVAEKGEKISKKKALEIIEYVKREVANDFNANVTIEELDEKHIHDPRDAYKILKGQAKKKAHARRR